MSDRKVSLKNNSSIKNAAERMFAGAEKYLFERAAELRGPQTHAEELL